MKSTPIIVFILVVFVVVSDLNTKENVDAAKKYFTNSLKNNTFTHTFLEMSSTSVSYTSIIHLAWSSFLGAFAFKLPV